jgi:hypothetical protein
MRKAIVYSFLILLFSSFIKEKKTCPTLQFDGIYVFKIDNENSAVIRFYSDKLVLVSTSVNDYAAVMTWFNRDPENASRVLTGKYSVKSKNCSVNFRVKGETGEQVYSGIITDEKTIQFSIYNPKDKTSTSRSYTFVKP